MQKRLDSFFRQSDENAEPREKRAKANPPLAQMMRPKTLDDFIVSSPSLQVLLKMSKLPSIILWGPPGCGKTSLANLLADRSGSNVFKLSAVNATVADLKQVVACPPAVLFLDEIHRFNKSQQDYLLPHVESGTITLIGATTENVYSSVNKALLSRCRVFQLPQLSPPSILQILNKAANAHSVSMSPSVASRISELCGGDAREAINILEAASLDGQVSLDAVETLTCTRGVSLDKSMQVDAISALQKSIRGSDRDAALVWLALLLENGEDPMYVARRIVRTASEDVGLANPMALVLSNAALQATATTGMPECSTALAEAVCYLCDSPKSNAVEVGYMNAKALVESMGNRLVVPPNISARKQGYVYTNQPEAKAAGSFAGVQRYLPHLSNPSEIFPKVFKYVN
jgi:putative ATPase